MADEIKLSNGRLVKPDGTKVVASDIFADADINALTVSTADGTDATTTQALANALKVKLNALIALLGT